nr:UrcA family protein [uncultured Sphingosinicella sp.]
MFVRTLSAAAASALLLATPALAQTETMTVEVRTADLNLASVAGQAQLQRRISAAAGQICGAAPRSLDMLAAHTSCRSEVLGDAAQKIAALKAQGGTAVQVASAAR